MDIIEENKKYVILRLTRKELKEFESFAKPDSSPDFFDDST
jgi:hypothetical protein